MATTSGDSATGALTVGVEGGCSCVSPLTSSADRVATLRTALATARPEWHIIQDILAAADAPFLNNPDIHRQVLDHHAAGEHYPEEAMYRAVLPDDLTLEQVMATPGGIEFPLPAQGEFYEHHLKTPDHRIQLAPDEFASALDLALDTPTRLSAEYPLMPISGFRRLRSFNSWTHNMPSLTDKLDEPHAHLHPATAAGLKIADGAPVRLVTEAGAITLPARITDRIRPDTVAVPQFWGHTYPSGQLHARRRPATTSTDSTPPPTPTSSPGCPSSTDAPVGSNPPTW